MPKSCSPDASYGTTLTPTTKPSKSRIVKNLVVLSVTWWMLFSAYDGLVMLQSTLNSRQGIGVTSVSVQHACSCVTALLLPKYLIRRVGTKVVIVGAIVSHAPYVAANFYPHWILMVVTSVVLGAANPLLWAALCAYVNNLSLLYSGHVEKDRELRDKKLEDAAVPTINGSVQKDNNDLDSSKVLESSSARFYHSTGVEGRFEKDRKQRRKISSDIDPTVDGNVQKHNLDPLPYLNVLESSSAGFYNSMDTEGRFEVMEKNKEPQGMTQLELMGSAQKKVEPAAASSSSVLESTTAMFFGFHGMAYSLCNVTSNLTSYFILSMGMVGEGYATNSSACSCGAAFCNDQESCFDANLKPPGDAVRQLITAVFVALVVLSVVLVVFLLDETGREQVPFSMGFASASCRLMKKPRMLLLIPMMLYIGIAQGFFMGDYTQAYVGCWWGVHNVGLVAATFGACVALASSCSGLIVRRVGRPPIFLSCAALKGAAVALLLCWTPDPRRPAAFLFLVAGMMGFVLGCYWSQLRAFLGILFRDEEEAAFGNYQFWHSVGAAVAFGYSKYLCTSVKIYIVLVLSALAISGYLIVERSYSRTKRK